MPLNSKKKYIREIFYLSVTLNFLMFFLSLIVLIVIIGKSEASIFKIFVTHFPVIFGAEYTGIIMLKFIRMLIINSLFLFSALYLLVNILRNNVLSSIVLFFMYLIPYVIPFIDGKIHNFNVYNPFSYFDIDQNLSGVRDFYWNNIETANNTTYFSGFLYVLIITSIITIFNMKLLNYRRRTK